MPHTKSPTAPSHGPAVLSGASPLCTVAEAIEDIRAGKMVIVVDDEDRENEGDLVMAADLVTPAAINFMAREGRGLICLSLTNAKADALNLPLMTDDNTSSFGTAFTVSIEARKGVTTGISAADRATTIAAAMADDAGPQDLARPGHVFPLRARDGGVLVRAGQTEASVDLARMAGRRAAGVICEVMRDDGEMARLPDLEVFAKKHGMKICSVAQIIEHRMHHERVVERIAWAKLPTQHGYFDCAVYRSLVDGKEHLALCHNVKPSDLRSPDEPGYADTPVLVRVHSECLTGDALGSLRCDCGEQIARAMEQVQQAERGVVIYMRQEGRGIGLANKIKAYALQDQGYDTVQANEMLGMKADQREYGTGAQMLRDLGIGKMLLMSNNPRKFTALDGYGLEIVDRVPLEVKARNENKGYLKTKRDKLGHMLKLPESGRMPAVKAQ
jgi:3,4-dihydroxy 2-butanone 4-phosphate synthase/GTP cyclohydrolase II